LDKRVLAAIALVAVVAGIALMRPAPGVESPALPDAPDAAERRVAAAAAAPAPTRPRPVLPTLPADDREAPLPIRPDGTVRSNEAPSAAIRQPPQQSVEYRCRALGQQAELVDKLVVVGAGSAIDDDQRVKVLSRVAQLSARVYDEGAALRSGNLECGDIGGVDLSSARDFLYTTRDQVADLMDEDQLAEIDQALMLIESEPLTP